MDPADAARILGVQRGAAPDEVRRAFRTRIRAHHPDRVGAPASAQASTIIEAYRLLLASGPLDVPPPPPPPPQPTAGTGPGPGWSVVEGSVQRLDGDTLLIGAPAEETFRALLDAAHDIGEITYVDRSMPIMEVLCRFEGEPATSLLVTLQGRGHGTEAFCTVESIEARPAPPTALVVDLLEGALIDRATGGDR